MDEKLLQTLRERSVLRTTPDKPFVLKSGATSLTYVDIRLTALTFEGLRLLASELVAKMFTLDWRPDYVAGVVVDRLRFEATLRNVQWLVPLCLDDSPYLLPLRFEETVPMVQPEP